MKIPVEADEAVSLFVAQILCYHLLTLAIVLRSTCSPRCRFHSIEIRMESNQILQITGAARKVENRCFVCGCPSTGSMEFRREKNQSRFVDPILTRLSVAVTSIDSNPASHPSHDITVERLAVISLSPPSLFRRMHRFESNESRLFVVRFTSGGQLNRISFRNDCFVVVKLRFYFFGAKAERCRG